MRGGDEVAEIRSLVESPVIETHPTFGVVGDRSIRVALCTPGGAEPWLPSP